MKMLCNMIWWAAFITSAVVVQSLLPGLDALVVGLLILLQNRDYKNMFWLAPFFIFLQEGMGTRFFGGSIFLYSVVVVIFRMSLWFFEVENFLFVFLLSACLMVPYYVLDWFMASLQNITFDMEKTLDKCFLQAVFLPFAWYFCTMTRRWTKYDDVT
ncbi:MAG: hypothetical protein LBS77_06705 [Desulfovibrio sp.]|jgi:hypothetical protein|nr:hypothetical protein [Desulfovibrio sp.]